MANKISITGTTGFLGSRIAFFFQKKGWDVIALTRQATKQGLQSTSFQLGNRISSSVFEDSKVLVHCAYDFGVKHWKDIVKINVEGSRYLFEAGRSGGIQKIIFISSLSAYKGNETLYGQAKAEIEKIVYQIGGVSIRPGLIYGERPRGVYGRLLRFVSLSPIIPLLGPKNQSFFMSHEEDLSQLVFDLATSQLKFPSLPIFAAHPEPIIFEDLLRSMAMHSSGKKLFVRFPNGLAKMLFCLGSGCGLYSLVNEDQFKTLLNPNKCHKEKEELIFNSKLVSYFRPMDLQKIK